MLENTNFSKKEKFSKGMWCFKYYREKNLKTGRRVLIEKSETIEEKVPPKDLFHWSLFCLYILRYHYSMNFEI